MSFTIRKIRVFVLKRPSAQTRTLLSLAEFSQFLIDFKNRGIFTNIYMYNSVGKIPLWVMECGQARQKFRTAASWSQDWSIGGDGQKRTRSKRERERGPGTGGSIGCEEKEPESGELKRGGGRGGGEDQPSPPRGWRPRTGRHWVAAHCPALSCSARSPLLLGRRVGGGGGEGVIKQRGGGGGIETVH